MINENNISKAVLSKYVEEKGLERIVRGIYITDDVWSSVDISGMNRQCYKYPCYRRYSSIIAYRNNEAHLHPIAEKR